MLGLLSFGSIVQVEAATAEQYFVFNPSTGTITDYNNIDGPKDVVIPSTIGGVPVTNIGYAAFNGNDLTSAVIPDSVITIGEHAFSYNSMTSATLGANVINIGPRAFTRNQIESINIPSSVTSIGDEAFSCNRLTSIIIPNGVTSIQFDSFSYNLISSVVIPDTVTSIGVDAFKFNSITSVTIPNSVTSIGSYAFHCNQITSLNIPNSVTSIGTSAFSYNSITSLSIPNSLTSLSNEVFRENQLTSVAIPSSITSIGDNAFRGNELNSVVIPDSVTCISTGAFAINKLTSLSIPSSVTNIGEYAFGENLLTSLNIPNNVTTIGTAAFANNLLTDVSIGSGITSIVDTLFQNNKFTTVNIPNTVTSIGNYAFDNNLLTSLVIPDSIISIGNYAFSNNQLASITIGSNVTSIGNYSFAYNQLASVTIPDSVISIGENTFRESQLTSLIIGSGVTSIGGSAFAVNQLTNVSIGSGVSNIGGYAFAYNQLASISIPDSVTSIGSYAFTNNLLTNVSLGSGVSNIGDYAFRSNPLDNITIPNSVTSIGAYAFQYNQLTSVSLGNNVVNIGDSAFVDNNITSVIIPNSVVTIGEYAFRENAITSLILGESVTEIKRSAFGFNNITSITIPTSVTTIGVFAFGNNRLTKVVIPDTVTSIGDSAFYYQFPSWSILIIASDPSVGKTYALSEGHTFGKLYPVVSFESNGGSSVGNIASVYDTTIAEPALPTKGEIPFGGWYKESTFANQWNFATDKVPPQDTTLYAKWTYNLTYIADVNGSITGAASQMVDHGKNGTQVTASPAFGYHFQSWSDGVNTASRTDSNIISHKEATATFTINTYTITFTDYDGTVLKTESVIHGDDATAPADPTRVGYTFTGWDLDFTNVSGNLNIIAQYDANQYQVTFQSNGGSTVNSVIADYDTTIQTPTLSTKEGYTLEGWYKEEGCVNIWDFYIDTIPTNNIILYAKWTINSYTVSFDSKEGSSIDSQILNYGTLAAIPTNPTKIGHTFEGWYKEEGCINIWDFNIDTIPVNNITLYAKWSVNSYTVSFDSKEGSSIEGQILNYGTKIIEPINPTKTNYIFGGWYKDEGYINQWNFETNTVPANNITLYTKWLFTYTLESLEDQTMAPINSGYVFDLQETKTIMLNRTGTGELTNITVVLSGENADDFIIINPLVTVLDAETSGTTFNVKARDGLASGNYTAIVTVSAESMVNVSFTVTQVVNLPPAPTIESVNSGNRHVNITWNSIVGATGYNIYKSTLTGEYEYPLATVDSSVLSYDVRELVNGTTYYFVIRAIVVCDESMNSNEVSSIPQTRISGPVIIEDNEADDNIIIPSPTIDNDTGNAKIDLTSESIDNALINAPMNSEGIKKLDIEIPKATEVNGYMIEISSLNLFGIEKQELEIKTDLGKINLPGNMLSDKIEGSINISLMSVDKNKLPEETKVQIGDRPIIEINLSKNGNTINWENPLAPVTISLPYVLQAEENKNAIVVYYIDNKGILKTVRGKYNSETGMVDFRTNHFSQYAVGYNEVTFNDVVETAWYKEAVDFIAAREITTGTGNGNYSPNAKLTRAQFLVMMMRSYGIEPNNNTSINFYDAGNTYYTGYLAAAKELGISGGVGNNMYAPEKEITRQEMFALLYNTLKLIDEIPEGADGKELTAFSDVDQIAPWAKDAVTLLVRTGMISGNDGKLCLQDTTNRAQMAQMLYNLLSK